MRRSFLIYIMLLIAGLTMAQTQQGVVKTKGRMVNGKHVKGTALTGAVVTIKGQNAVAVKNADGSFSFPTANRSFFIQSVTKNGYQLVDADAAPKGYVYSTNPLILLLETPSQQAEDRLTAERKIRRTLQRQLEQREDELEKLKAQNKLSQKEYQEQLQQLYDDQENNEKLIAEMAKEYSQIDYDQMDELNRQISDAILNGDLLRADSLLRSKGDMNTRVAELRKAQQAEAKREVEIAREQQELAASKEGTKKKLGDLAQDCKNYYERFKKSLSIDYIDSAAYYIQLRAELDTTNADWQFDAAYYFQEYPNFRNYKKLTELYYKRALRIYRQMAKTDSQTYEPKVASTLINMGDFYTRIGWNKRSEAHSKEALEICRMLIKSNPKVYNPMMAQSLNNLGILYKVTKRPNESEAMYKEALEIRRRLAIEDSISYAPFVAETLHEMGMLYRDNKVYGGTLRNEESKSMFYEALEIRRRLVKYDQEAYYKDYTTTLSTLVIDKGWHFDNKDQETQHYEELEPLYKECVIFYKQLQIKHKRVSLFDIAVENSIKHLISFYTERKQLKDCIPLYLELFDVPLSNNSLAARIRRNMKMTNLADIYHITHQYREADVYYGESASFFSLYGEETLSLYVSVLKKWSFNTLFLKNYIGAEQQARKALDLDTNAVYTYRHLVAANLAHALIFQGKYGEAEKIYRQYKDKIKESCLNDFIRFAEENVIPEERKEDVEKIKRMLNE